MESGRNSMRRPAPRSDRVYRSAEGRSPAALRGSDSEWHAPRAEPLSFPAGELRSEVPFVGTFGSGCFGNRPQRLVQLWPSHYTTLVSAQWVATGRACSALSGIIRARMRRLIFVLFTFALPLHAATTPASVAALVTHADAAPQLAAALRDATPLVRATAARVIGVRNFTEALPAVRETLANESDATAAREGIRALALIGTAH